MKIRAIVGWPSPPLEDCPGDPALHAGSGPRPYLAAVAFPMEVEEAGHAPPGGVDPERGPTVVLRNARELHSWAERRFLFYRVIDLAVPFAAVVPENLRVPDDAMREAGSHVALAVHLLMTHRPLEEVREAIASLRDTLRDGTILHVEDAFPVTAAITERREGSGAPEGCVTYHLEHPDGRTVPLAEPEEMIAVAERLRPEDFRGLVSGKDVLRHARGVVLPAAVHHGTVLRVRCWPPRPLEL